jgi:hypothetical protein
VQVAGEVAITSGAQIHTQKKKNFQFNFHVLLSRILFWFSTPFIIFFALKNDCGEFSCLEVQKNKRNLMVEFVIFFFD